jgi:hypothetical protein
LPAFLILDTKTRTEETNMKPNNARTKLTFGDFIRWAYVAYGKRRAKGIVTLAINARLLEFRGPQRIEISEQE